MLSSVANACDSGRVLDFASLDAFHSSSPLRVKTPLGKWGVDPDDVTATLSLEGKVQGGKRLLSAKDGKYDRARDVWKRDR